MRHYGTLHTYFDKGILTITMNRPEKRNALNPEMIHDLTDAFLAAGDDPSCRVILLTGAGNAF
ncbi:MAG: enoyl-CoA hydratase/isomerase family protein, partial [Acidobacteriaceae bacterium]|nr:enoyl-CoA hydratase/isomerase family protein [Acidobacteriaceae bacterium]